MGNKHLTHGMTTDARCDGVFLRAQLTPFGGPAMKRRPSFSSIAAVCMIAMFCFLMMGWSPPPAPAPDPGQTVAVSPAFSTPAPALAPAAGYELVIAAPQLAVRYGATPEPAQRVELVMSIDSDGQYEHYLCHAGQAVLHEPHYMIDDPRTQRSMSPAWLHPGKSPGPLAPWTRLSC